MTSNTTNLGASSPSPEGGKSLRIPIEGAAFRPTASKRPSCQTLGASQRITARRIPAFTKGTEDEQAFHSRRGCRLFASLLAAAVAASVGLGHNDQRNGDSALGERGCLFSGRRSRRDGMAGAAFVMRKRSEYQRQRRIQSPTRLKFLEAALLWAYDEERIQLETAALLLPASNLHLSCIRWVPASVRTT